MSEEPDFSDDPSSSPFQPASSESDSDEAESGTGGPASPFDGGDAFDRESVGDASDDSFAAPDAFGGGSRRAQLRMAWDVTRMWIEEHQTATMLGAFAAGVFVGASLRD